ncbi:MAG TPA: DedA family protein [Phycisphaerales bacterium]|nr:DedA family protein [Phycisphaerales bacterium]HMP36196.1 DedA family protein [Phycisphaerales bacterium]
MLESIVSTYGYLAVLLGTAIEGETFLVLGGFFAHRGYLSLPWVIVAAFVGSLVADQAWFFIGRFRGVAMIERRPHWQRHADRAARLIKRNELLVALGFRFVYGARTITPIMLGATKYPPLRFAAINALGGAIWAIGFGLLGYLFGETATRILGELERWEMWIAGAILVAGSGALTWCVVSRRAARPGRQSSIGRGDRTGGTSDGQARQET